MLRLHGRRRPNFGPRPHRSTATPGEARVEGEAPPPAAARLRPGAGPPSASSSRCGLPTAALPSGARGGEPATGLLLVFLQPTPTLSFPSSRRPNNFSSSFSSSLPPPPPPAAGAPHPAGRLSQLLSCARCRPRGEEEGWGETASAPGASFHSRQRAAILVAHGGCLRPDGAAAAHGPARPLRTSRRRRRNTTASAPAALRPSLSGSRRPPGGLQGGGAPAGRPREGPEPRRREGSDGGGRLTGRGQRSRRGGDHIT